MPEPAAVVTFTVATPAVAARARRRRRAVAAVVLVAAVCVPSPARMLVDRIGHDGDVTSETLVVAVSFGGAVAVAI